MILDDGQAGRRARLGLLALAAAHALWELSGRAWFPHAGLPHGASAAGIAEQLAGAAVLVFGLLLGRELLRDGKDRATLAVAAFALASLAPFAVDIALAPLPWLIASGELRRDVFLGASAAALIVVAVAVLHAVGRFPPPAPSPWRAAFARFTGRAALLLAALAVAWSAAELVLARLGVGERAWSRPLLIIPGDERRVPLSEITLFRPFDGPAAAQGLSTRFRPYLFLKGWYDRPRWSYFDAQGQVDYVFNQYGLRDHDFALEKQPGEFRVVAIGDSFTFGVGVQLDDCWTEVAEKELRARRGGPVEVINAGFASGYMTANYEDWILKDGVRLKPDVVVIGFCLNDMNPAVSLYAWDPPPRVVQWLGGSSRVLNALTAAWDGPLPPRHLIDWTGLVASDPHDWLADQAALRRLHEKLTAQGIRLVVLPFPMMSGLRDTPYPYKALLDQVAAFCEAEGIEHVDLLPRVLGRVDEDLWVHPTDQHPNDVGHRLIADGLVDYLEPK